MSLQSLTDPWVWSLMTSRSRRWTTGLEESSLSESEMAAVPVTRPNCS